VLDGRGVQLIGQGLVHQFTGGAVVAEHPDLDQPMGVERGVGFL
jgi:hypothetical protein